MIMWELYDNNSFWFLSFFQIHFIQEEVDRLQIFHERKSIAKSLEMEFINADSEK